MEGSVFTMNREEWGGLWKRMRGRWPEWEPSTVEVQDWAAGLVMYDAPLVEDSARVVAMSYSSRTPRLKWVLDECERRRMIILKDAAREAGDTPSWQIDSESHEQKRQATIDKLTATPIEELREAVRQVVKEHRFVKMPKGGNIEEWPPTLRAMVALRLGVGS